MNSIKNPDQLWANQKAKLKLTYPLLHDEDLRYDYPGKNIMLNTLSQKLNKSVEELNLMLIGL